MIQKSLTEGSAPDSQGAGTGRAGGEGRMELREGLTSCWGGMGGPRASSGTGGQWTKVEGWQSQAHKDFGDAFKTFKLGSTGPTLCFTKIALTL